MKNQVLIITNKQDSHTDKVIKYLIKKNISVFRLNTEDLLIKYKINLSIGDNGNWFGTITDELNRVLDLKTLKVAWLRKPKFDFASNYTKEELGIKKFMVSEAKAFISILYSMSHITWINNPIIADGMKSKFQQLLLAKELGVKIPKTLITTVPNKAESFLEENGNRVLIKSIYTGNVTLHGRNQSIPSKLITRNEFKKYYKNIELTPTQFQEYIEKNFELRVTVIKNKVFAAKIESQLNEKTKIDWRKYTNLNPHSIFKLPKKIEKFCIKFIEQQKLIYGAIDFIVTPDNEYVFLENNPFGQYLWLEIETGLPLTKEIGDLLISYLE